MIYLHVRVLFWLRLYKRNVFQSKAELCTQSLYKLSYIDNQDRSCDAIRKQCFCLKNICKCFWVVYSYLM